MRPAMFSCRFSRSPGETVDSGFEGTASGVACRASASYFCRVRASAGGRRRPDGIVRWPRSSRVRRYRRCRRRPVPPRRRNGGCGARRLCRLGGVPVASMPTCGLHAVRAPVFVASGPAAVGAPRALAVKWPHPTRLETRTKESNTRASPGAWKPFGAMKVNVWVRAAASFVRGASSTDLVCSQRGSSRSARVGTRKMVNYARIG